MSLMLTLSDISPDTWCHEITAAPQFLGRAESADIQLDHGTISRRHCRFWMEKDDCFVEDCSSTNGTYFNGERIERQKICDGDRILIGAFELLVSEKDKLNSTVEFRLRDEEEESDGDQDARQAAEPQHKTPEQEQRRLAAAVQQCLTPSRRMCLPGMLIEVAYRPSGLLGGDGFECFALGDRWVLAQFDSMNHGVSAALGITLLRAELGHWMSLTAEPGRCLTWINQAISSLGIDDLYICASLAVWYPATGTLVYSTAGQHPPLVFRRGTVLNPGETAGGLPLGAAADEQYEEHLQPLSPGDRLFSFTDGISDAIRERQTGGTTTELLAQQLCGAADETLQHQVQSIIEGLSENLFDDLLLVGCEVIAPAAGKPGDLELIE